ncbi:hypothetical protein SNE40_002857 [Patella caerulea]|uniref:Uncharacterized protein n=1 Tax=Patella caerulea TaxID=87958 RepID=A0AAN8K9L8_PATCE
MSNLFSKGNRLTPTDITKVPSRCNSVILVALKCVCIFLQSKKRSKEDLDEDKKDIFCSVQRRTPLKSESEMKNPAHIPSSNSACTQVTLLNHNISEPDLTGLDVVKVANDNGDSSINNHVSIF